MANENLNKLCMDESDPMLNVVVKCKHEILDKEDVDQRSSFILSRLVGKINELEQELCIRHVHIDNLRRLNRRWKWCRFNRKILLCILICVVAMFINNQYVQG
ncbi:hypothetical protein H5410_037736 [Solanum commersonii]|uniref:Uncharacterized protein n=1 Tax=Solanum commersonii TaxID=4109 RepID=A0A9J5YAC8_SOLCO|nr:hypothetical protein H5410_037736 [Solanum commersonii]